MAKVTQTHAAGMTIRQMEPANLETPLDQVDSYLTPAELFYIRSHFPAPRLELASYQLRIDGAVRTPRRPSQQAVVLALFLALVGLAMALYTALA